MTQMTTTPEFEDEIRTQVSSLKRGKAYLEIKEDVSINHDTVTTLKIAQEAYKRFRYARIKKSIISGFLLLIFTISLSFFDKNERTHKAVVIALITICVVCYNIYLFYNYKRG